MFGDIEKELRIKHGLKQTQVAHDLGLSRAAICKYESNTREPSISTLLAFCTYYEVSADYLLGRSNNDKIR